MQLDGVTVKTINFFKGFRRVLSNDKLISSGPCAHTLL